MNTLTKVFIVLNLIVAIAAGVVVTFMYAYQENYKRRWDYDTKALYDDNKLLGQKIKEVSFEAEVAKSNLSINHQKLQDAQARNLELQNTVEAKTGEIASLQTTISELTNINMAQQQRIDGMTQSLRVAEKRKNELNSIAQVARGVAFQLSVKLAEIEDDLANAEAELTRRERTVFELEGDLKRKDALLAKVRTEHPRVFDQITGDGANPSATPINAVVAAVRDNPQGEQDLVMLTVGRDDEVSEGMEFVVYRANQYIVKVRAERVMNDMVACRVLPNTWNGKEVMIQPGDLATTRLF